jgi:Flp pilus assembly protein TadD
MAASGHVVFPLMLLAGLSSWAGCSSLSGGADLTVQSRRDPLAARRLNDRGLELLRTGRLAEAEGALRAALAADHYCGPAHCNLGLALLQRGAFFEAGWQLRHACRLMPKASQPRANLGLLYEMVGRYGPAEQALRDALALAPDDIEVIGQLARVQVRRGSRTAETAAWLRAVATRDDDEVWRRWARRELIRIGNRELDTDSSDWR